MFYMLLGRVLAGLVQWRIPGTASSLPCHSGEIQVQFSHASLKPAVEEQLLPFQCPSALPSPPQENTSLYKRKSNKGRYTEAFSSILCSKYMFYFSFLKAVQVNTYIESKEVGSAEGQESTLTKLTRNSKTVRGC